MEIIAGARKHVRLDLFSIIDTQVNDWLMKKTGWKWISNEDIY